MEHNDIYHHGVKGMRWGIRRKKQEYKRDVGEAIKKAGDKGDHDQARSMYIAKNAERNYAKHMIRGAVGGLAVSGYASYKFHVKGKKLARNLILSGLGGMTIGALRASSQVERGKFIAEGYYSVKGMDERE